MSVKVVPLVAVVALLAACGGHKSSTPGDDPGVFAVNVVKLITGNSYTPARDDLHSTDKQAASVDEYLTGEKRWPVLTARTAMKVVGVSEESVGLGNGSFVNSKAVHVRMVF